MSAPDQLSMFEPEGDELARLAKRHADTGDTLTRSAASCEARGLKFVAAEYRRFAGEARRQAEVCESALQFEREAGL